MGCRQVSRHTRGRAWGAGAVWSNRNAVFHASLVRAGGGERRRISAAVSRSRIIMGPPHWGQGHEQGEGGVFGAPSSPPGGSSGVGGKLVGRPRSWKQTGKSALRRRWARKPKWRMRTKPGGSTWSRKRRKNSSTARVIRRCWLPCAESLQRNVTWLPSRATKR